MASARTRLGGAGLAREQRLAWFQSRARPAATGDDTGALHRTTADKARLTQQPDLDIQVQAIPCTVGSQYRHLLFQGQGQAGTIS